MTDLPDPLGIVPALRWSVAVLWVLTVLAVPLALAGEATPLAGIGITAAFWTVIWVIVDGPGDSDD